MQPQIVDVKIVVAAVSVVGSDGKEAAVASIVVEVEGDSVPLVVVNGRMGEDGVEGGVIIRVGHYAYAERCVANVVVERDGEVAQRIDIDIGHHSIVVGGVVVGVAVEFERVVIG